jgi:hypothetical protein
VVASVPQADGVIEIAQPDPTAVLGESYDYRVTAYHGDLEGPPSVWVEGVAGSGLTAAPESSARTSVLSLAPATPNPFNPHTTLRLTLPEAGPVRVTVHDVTGRLVDVLVDGERPAGEHAFDWDGTDVHGRDVASGVYFVRLASRGEVLSRKIVLER